MKLFDSVALIVDMPERKLCKGSTGTIVELLDNNNYLVEFSDLNGVMYAIPVVHEEHTNQL